MKKTLLRMKIIAGFIVLLIGTSVSVNAQCTIIPNATTGLTLTYVLTGGTNATGVAYNPDLDLYYTAIAGNSSFPLETYDGGGTPLYQTNTGFDMRGLWWNRNLSSLESNGYNTLGVWRYNLNASGYALNTGVLQFSGMQQPQSQSVGDYDCVSDEIVYYNAGTIQRRSRATGALLTTVTITGLPVSTANLNNNTIFYTDCTGHEYGLVDYVLKRVYFVDKATGAYAGMSQLPGTAVTNNSFRASWANGMAWLYNTANRTWTSYNVLTNIDGPCTVVLPIELISFQATKQENRTVALRWETASEDRNDYFTVERSQDGTEWVEIGKVDGAGTSSKLLNYQFLQEDQPIGLCYYRLKQTDYDGETTYSGVRSLQFTPSESSNVLVFPNPATDQLTVLGVSQEEQIELFDLAGSSVELRVITCDENGLTLDVRHLTAGMYSLRTGHSVHKVLIR